jgi:hypothetical protein
VNEPDYTEDLEESTPSIQITNRTKTNMIPSGVLMSNKGNIKEDDKQDFINELRLLFNRKTNRDRLLNATNYRSQLIRPV